jgi:hypothetical protein
MYVVVISTAGGRIATPDAACAEKTTAATSKSVNALLKGF